MRCLGLALILCFAGLAQAKPREGLLGGSLVSLGSLYAANVGTALISAAVEGSFEQSSLNALFIPIAGPFIALGDPRNAPALRSVPLVIDCVATVGTITWVIISIVLDSAASSPRTWLLTPGAARAPLGASFTILLP